MKLFRQIPKTIGLLAAFALLVGCNRNSDSSAAGGATDAQSQSSGGDTNSTAALAPDNTGKNVRDRSDATLTPGDQGSTDADREITRRIRRAITANDQLSTTAENIKIITVNGKVTLRGPVQNQQEKSLIESIVQRSGVTAFDDQLQPKTTNQ
ncbi:Transport-associated protein [Verrucomicrobia bacterium]|nr:Transport-associated protein [Verrucomicrobiota bacterium]